MIVPRHTNKGNARIIQCGALNEGTNISVRTSEGESGIRQVKNSIGKGMFGELASSLNIGCALKKTFIGKPYTMLGIIPLNSFIMQDDINKMNDTLEDARSGCEKIDDTLKRKQLSVNYDKSKYLLIGSQKFRNDMLKTLKVDPVISEQGRRNYTSVGNANDEWEW